MPNREQWQCLAIRGCARTFHQRHRLCFLTTRMVQYYYYYYYIVFIYLAWHSVEIFLWFFACLLETLWSFLFRRPIRSHWFNLISVSDFDCCDFVTVAVYRYCGFLRFRVKWNDITAAECRAGGGSSDIRRRKMVAYIHNRGFLENQRQENIENILNICNRNWSSAISFRFVLNFSVSMAERTNGSKWWRAPS